MTQAEMTQAERLLLGTVARGVRDIRQLEVVQWGVRAFGYEPVHDRGERIRRLLEEAIELAQAECLPEGVAHDLVRYVYSRPAGTIEREAGGVAICLLAYCEVLGLSADLLEAQELARCKAKIAEQPHHFAQRQLAKAEWGIGRTPTVAVASGGKGEAEGPK